MIFGKTTFAGGALGFNLGEISNLISDKGLLETGLVRHVDNRWQEYFNKPDAKLSKWMTLIDLKIRLPELLLMRMDKLVMQSGVETRVPFLDHKLVEFIYNFPKIVITPDDIKTVSELAIAHRIILKPEHQIKGLEAGEVIQTILREVPVPTV